MVDGAEYKRQQAAPGLKISLKAFGYGRRFPIAAKTGKWPDRLQNFRLSKGTHASFVALLLPGSLLVSFSVAQQKSANRSKDAPPPRSPRFSTRLPSEETVNAFMKQMFGYDPSVSWKIAAIRPSPAEGLTEVMIVLSNAQGQQNSRLYVTADGKHAVIGDIIPFGAHPFAPRKKALSKGMNGPSRGPADAPGDRGRVQRPAVPALQGSPAHHRQAHGAKRKTFAWYSRIFRCPRTTGPPKPLTTVIASGTHSPDAFWKYVASVYDAQKDITAGNADEKLTAMADQAGVKGPISLPALPNPTRLRGCSTRWL